MNSKQTTVMWLGLLLVAVRMATTGQWTVLWSTVTKSASGGASISSTISTSPATTSSSGTVSV